MSNSANDQLQQDKAVAMAALLDELDQVEGEIAAKMHLDNEKTVITTTSTSTSQKVGEESDHNQCLKLEIVEAEVPTTVAADDDESKASSSPRCDEKNTSLDEVDQHDNQASAPQQEQVCDDGSNPNEINENKDADEKKGPQQQLDDGTSSTPKTPSTPPPDCTAKVVEIGKRRHYFFDCPHCGGNVVVPINAVNCAIFRHGVSKKSGRQVPPHSKKYTCDQLTKGNEIYGCGKPIRLVARYASKTTKKEGGGSSSSTSNKRGGVVRPTMAMKSKGEIVYVAEVCGYV